MAALRYPFSLASGFLVSLAGFFGLVQLIGAPLDVGDPVFPREVNYTPQRPETPVDSKRDPKVERPPPPVTVPVTGPGRIDTDVTTATRIDLRRIDVVDIGGRGGLAVGSDRDVLPLVRINPEYPPRALNGTEGWVQVRFTVTEIGSVRDAVVVASEPGTIFDEAALRAIARWRYNPRVDGGVAVERVGLETIIRFELEK